MFGLRDQICGDESRIRRLIRQHHDFTGARNTIDVDFPKHMLFGKCHKQVSWTDNFINTRKPLDTVSHRGHRLSTTNSINFGHSDFRTGCQQ